MSKMPKDNNMNNDEKTLKVPRVVHLTLKRLSVQSGLPIYGVLAKLLLMELTNPSLLCLSGGDDCGKKDTGVAATH